MLFSVLVHAHCGDLHKSPGNESRYRLESLDEKGRPQSFRVMLLGAFFGQYYTHGTQSLLSNDPAHASYILLIGVIDPRLRLLLPEP